jgi:hypothetical protein|tara:strand:+ start:207 stop:392 length:186 start_codon:yes stop_codon:yes gene_type:complete
MELKIINNQIIDKIQLEYILRIIENDMEKLEENMEYDMLEGEEEELKMIQDLYRKLVILNK